MASAVVVKFPLCCIEILRRYFALIVVLLFFTTVDSIPTQELDAMLSTIRARGYNLFSNAIATSDLQIDLLTASTNSSFTFFAPTDSSLFALAMTQSASAYTATIRYHGVPRRLSMADLGRLPTQVTIPTLLREQYIFVTRRIRGSRSDAIAVNGINVVLPGLYYGRHIVVHGLGGILSLNSQIGIEYAASPPIPPFRPSVPGSFPPDIDRGSKANLTFTAPPADGKIGLSSVAPTISPSTVAGITINLPSNHTFLGPAPERADNHVPSPETSSLQNSVRSPENSSLENPVPSPANSSLGNSVPSPVNSSLENSVPSPVNSSLQNSVPSPVNSSLQNSVSSPENSSLENSVPSPENSSLENPVPSPANSSLENPVPSPANSSLENPVPSPANSSLENPVSSSANSSLQNSVPSPDNSSLENPVPSPENSSLENPVPSPASSSLENPVPSPENSYKQNSNPSPSVSPSSPPIVSSRPSRPSIHGGETENEKAETPTGLTSSAAAGERTSMMESGESLKGGTVEDYEPLDWMTIDGKQNDVDVEDSHPQPPNVE